MSMGNKKGVPGNNSPGVVQSSPITPTFIQTYRCDICGIGTDYAEPISGKKSD